MNLIKSTSTFSFYVLISRILGYLRDVLIAIYLGSGPIADAFFVAFRIPNTFRRLFSEGTFNAAFVPSYSSEIVQGKKRAQQFANNVFNLLLIGLLFLILVIEIFMPTFVFLIAPGFTENSEKLELTILLTRITFPFLLFVSLSSFFGAILNSHNKFAAASAAPGLAAAAHLLAHRDPEAAAGAQRVGEQARLDEDLDGVAEAHEREEEVPRHELEPRAALDQRLRLVH